MRCLIKKNGTSDGSEDLFSDHCLYATHGFYVIYLFIHIVFIACFLPRFIGLCGQRYQFLGIRNNHDVTLATIGLLL